MPQSKLVTFPQGEGSLDQFEAISSWGKLKRVRSRVFPRLLGWSKEYDGNIQGVMVGRGLSTVGPHPSQAPDYKGPDPQLPPWDSFKLLLRLFPFWLIFYGGWHSGVVGSGEIGLLDPSRPAVLCIYFSRSDF